MEFSYRFSGSAVSHLRRKVGVLGVGPSVSCTPCMCVAATLYPGCFVERLDAIGADLHALAAACSARDPGPLEVGIAFGLAGWIVVAAKKHTGGYHDGLLAALWTSRRHTVQKTNVVYSVQEN